MSDPVSPDNAAPIKKPRLGILFLIVLTDMLGFGIIIPLMPFYAEKFVGEGDSTGSLKITLMLSIYAACQFLAAPVLGSLSDRVGRRPVLIFSQLGSAAASITLGIATAVHFGDPMVGLMVVYLSRIIDGISGGNISAAQAYVSDLVPVEQRAKYMGMLGAAFGIGFTLGPAIGGVLGHIAPYLPPFGAALASLIAASLAYFRLPESLREPVPHEPGSHLMKSVRLMKLPILAQLCLVWFISMSAFVTMEAIFPLFLSHRYGFKELGVGLTFMLAGLVIILVQGKLIGPLKTLIGEWAIAITGPLLFAGAMVLFVAAAVTSSPMVAILMVAVVFNAFGRSLMTPALSTLVSHAAPPRQQGAAFGLFHGMGSLSRVFGPAMAGFLYDKQMAYPFIAAGCLTLAASAWVVLIKLQARSKTAYVASATAEPSVEMP